MQQTEKIKELSQVMRANGIKVLEIKNPEEEIKIELFPIAAAEDKIVSQPQSSIDIITAPIMGIGYIFPPDQNRPFACVGDKVKKGSVLCIIEVMKIMNEVTAAFDCEIMEVSFDNGMIVEFGQTLFKVKRIDALSV